jgi:hypothetical protein
MFNSKIVLRDLKKLSNPDLGVKKHRISDPGTATLLKDTVGKFL